LNHPGLNTVAAVKANLGKRRKEAAAVKGTRTSSMKDDFIKNERWRGRKAAAVSNSKEISARWL
jgi:hypothetical protein